MNSNLIETASFPYITTTSSKHIHIYIHTYVRALESILSKHYYQAFRDSKNLVMHACLYVGMNIQLY